MPHHHDINFRLIIDDPISLIKELEFRTDSTNDFTSNQIGAEDSSTTVQMFIEVFL